MGVTVTLTEGGGGGGGFPRPAPAPPQLCSPAPAERKMRNRTTSDVRRRWFSGASILFTFTVLCVRGRMQSGMQAKGQRKEEAAGSTCTAMGEGLEACNYMYKNRLHGEMDGCRPSEAPFTTAPRSGLLATASAFGTELQTAVPKREGSRSAACYFAEASYLTDWLNTKVKQTSVNQMTCRAVWQVYGEGERFRLAQKT